MKVFNCLFRLIRTPFCGPAILAVLLAACETTQPTERSLPSIAVTSPGKVDEPTPVASTDTRMLDLEAVGAVRAKSLAEGLVAGHILRDTLVVRGLDPITVAMIDADLAWYAGDLEKSERQTPLPAAEDLAGQWFVLETLSTRAAIKNQWLQAARLAHQQLMLTLRADQSALTLPETSLTGSETVGGNRIWSLLMRLDTAQLARAIDRAEGNDWRGWLTLVQAYHGGRDATHNWLATHPNHSATQPLPAQLDRWLDSAPPRAIAVMVPLSGRLEAAGNAVLEGIMEGLYQQYRESDARPLVFTVDTNAYSNAVAAYRSALGLGADLVMGPLTKTEALSLGSLNSRPTPIIALNRPEALAVGAATHWSAMSLAPEDEARQIARVAFGKGQRRAMIIRPDTDWGRRMESAVSQVWLRLGGAVVQSLALQPEASESEQVGTVLGAADSENRITAFEAAFDAPVEARPRRRQDFDAVFLLASDPDEARRLRPLLIYHYSSDTPVYATSAIYDGQRKGGNQDLNGLVFLETPAVLNAAIVDRYTRLNALGFDAVTMVDHWRQGEAVSVPLYKGRTGLVRRLANGEVERELNPVEFDGGRLTEIQLP